MGVCGSTGCSEAEPFALRVLGDSMMPEFKEGHIIIIDPAAAYGDGSYVIAMHNEELIFRQLREHEGKYFLVPLNDLYDTEELGSTENIKGVVSQRSGTRRKERKFYDRASGEQSASTAGGKAQ